MTTASVLSYYNGAARIEFSMTDSGKVGMGTTFRVLDGGAPTRGDLLCVTDGGPVTVTAATISIGQPASGTVAYTICVRAMLRTVGSRDVNHYCTYPRSKRTVKTLVRAILRCDVAKYECGRAIFHAST